MCVRVTRNGSTSFRNESDRVSLNEGDFPWFIERLSLFQELSHTVSFQKLEIKQMLNLGPK